MTGGSGDDRSRDTEAWYRTLVEQMPAVAYIEPAGPGASATMFISSRVEQLLGYPVEEWMTDPDLWARILHPSDRERSLSRNERSDSTGEPFSLEYRMIARDGRTVWVRDDAILLQDETGGPLFWHGVMTDITASKQAEERLREAEEKYRSMVEELPGVLYTEHPDGRLLYISPQCRALLGVTAEEWLADPDTWANLLHPDDRERAIVEDESANRTGQTFSREYRLIARDGRTVWIHDACTLVHGLDGEPLHWFGVLTDISERRRAQALEHDLEVERTSSRNLRELDELKTTFLSAVSHDLRTPLTAILGLARTLEREELELATEEGRDLAGRIARNAQRLSEIVADLLDLDRLDRGGVELTKRPMDVGHIVAEHVERSDRQNEPRLHLELAPVTVPVDRAKVERIVENLISNALGHTPPDTQVWVKVSDFEEGALIAVDDEGPGVAEDMRELVFQPFQRGKDARGPGVGVGLSLVSRFADLHGGRAWVEERSGGGASFRVFLPGKSPGAA